MARIGGSRERLRQSIRWPPLTAVWLSVLLGLLCVFREPAPTSLAVGRVVSQSSVPAFGHVFVMVIENHERSDIIGNDAAPYIQQLASTYAQGSQQYGVAHPSLPNYVALITGSTQGLTDDCLPQQCGFDARSLPDQLEEAGLTWKAYMQDMPAPCYKYGTDLYDVSHNPFVYVHSIVTDETRCQSHVVNLDQLDDDLAAGTVPRFSFISPSLCADMHNCPIASGDSWLSGFLPRILNSSAFQQEAVVFLTWDEGVTDAGFGGTTGGGGNIPFLVLSPRVHPGLVSSTVGNHFSVLRTVEDAWGLPPLGNAAQATNLSGYWN